jgi:predicted dehydrogenase
MAEENETQTSTGRPLSRRQFLQTSAALSAAALAGGCVATGPRTGPAIITSPRVPQKLRVGLIGCGGRGTGAAQDCMKADPDVQIVALGDLFPDQLESSRKSLYEAGPQTQLAEERCFSGFDAYKGVLESDVDLVILATPPAFRPLHFRAAVEAGKHVFMEKPVAVDPAGVRTVIASSEVADQNGLSVVAGTQRRHQARYLDVMKRVRDGAIGDIVAGQCYWNQEGLWHERAKKNWETYQAKKCCDMEWQIRNWLFICWLSGDHIVEQHVHNLDVMNWAMGATPAKAMGEGGRQARIEPEYGNIYDHFAVEYEYPGGVRIFSMCRQIDKTSTRVTERVVGTRGVAIPSEGKILRGNKVVYEFEGDEINPYVQEHADLIASIRNNRPVNEARRVAESTLTAVMGRMSAYTGRELSWEWALNSSKLDLCPAECKMGECKLCPVPVPGERELL